MMRFDFKWSVLKEAVDSRPVRQILTKKTPFLLNELAEIREIRRSQADVLANEPKSQSDLKTIWEINQPEFAARSQNAMAFIQHSFDMADRSEMVKSMKHYYPVNGG
jgi:hypothetical protein